MDIIENIKIEGRGRNWWSFVVSLLLSKKLIVTAFFQVTFEGIKGLSYQSDIAIDDVSISDRSCPG